MVDKRCSWTRGKVLGGSSVLNTMLYVRGNKRDYDLWDALGNKGWSHEEVLPYFRKSEDQRNPYLAKNKRHHGTGKALTLCYYLNIILFNIFRRPFDGSGLPISHPRWTRLYSSRWGNGVRHRRYQWRAADRLCFLPIYTTSSVTLQRRESFLATGEIT